MSVQLRRNRDTPLPILALPRANQAQVFSTRLGRYGFAGVRSIVFGFFS